MSSEELRRVKVMDFVALVMTGLVAMVLLF
jgi:hypothetical protein